MEQRCDSKKIPKELHWNGEETYVFADGSEKLFRRTTKRIKRRGVLSGNDLDFGNRMPDSSFVRQFDRRDGFKKEVGPEIVLWDDGRDHFDDSQGVYSITPADIQNSVILAEKDKPGHPPLQIYFEHEPTACIFLHSELRVFQGNQKLKPTDEIQKRALRKTLRQKMAKKAVVEIESPTLA